MSTNGIAATGGSLRDRRLSRRISQQRLAEMADCSVSMVRLVESGYEPEASRVLDRIEAVLDAAADGSK